MTEFSLFRNQSRGGKFYLQYIDTAGRRRQVSTGETARRRALAFVRSYLVDPPPVVQKATIEQLAERVEEDAKAHLAPATVKRFHSCFAHFMRHLGAGKLISTVTAADVDHFRLKRLADGASRVTVNLEARTLASGFSKAARWGLLTTNPFAGCRPLREPPHPIKTFSPDELARVLNRLPVSVRDVAVFACLTGARLSECLHLRWLDVDFPNALFTIASTKEHPTKSGKTRSIPMHPDLACLLKAMAAEASGSYVFGKAGGLFPYDGGYISRAFTKACRSEGLTGVSFHCLRKTFATRLVARDVPLQVVSKLLGHAALATTEKHYAHIQTSTRHDAIALLPSITPAPAPSPPPEAIPDHRAPLLSITEFDHHTVNLN